MKNRKSIVRKAKKRKRTKSELSEVDLKAKAKRTESEVEIITIDDEETNTEDQLSACSSIAVAIEQANGLLNTSNFVVIQGPHGCGKTHAAKSISRRRGLPLRMLQINDQYDSKVLFGSYECTEVPGEFIWRHSKFSQFLQEPCLILLENLDHAGADLIASLLALIEDSGHCQLANGKHIMMNPNCRLLATISMENDIKIPQQLQEYPYAVISPNLDELDFKSIVATSTKNLGAIRERLVTTFVAVSKLINEQKASFDRALIATDLVRAAKRLDKLKDLNDHRTLFTELFDLWAGHLIKAELRQSVGLILGEALSLSVEEQHYFINVHQPEITTTKEHVQVGKAKLKRKSRHTSESPSKFVLTRDSAQLLERIANCTAQSEPVLLTGETGVGKTATMQHLARLVHFPLRVVNLSQESEFSDLVGGYKPTTPLNIMRPLADDYFRLFKCTFDGDKNAKFLDNLNKCFNAQRFPEFLQLVFKSSERAIQKQSKNNEEWKKLLQRARRLSRCFGRDDDSWRRRLLFSYMKGVITEAAEQGHWLLVDEINLASTECLDALIELLEPSESINPGFRLFACMNNANDVGKRSLPTALRSRFTEFCVWETQDPEQLHRIIRGQLPSVANELVEAVLHFYADIHEHFPAKFNLRSLNRALAIACDQLYATARHNLIRGCAIAFASQLNAEQRKQMDALIHKHFGKSPVPTINPKSVDLSKFVLVEGSKIPKGDRLVPDEEDNSYIFTQSVRANMSLLANVVSTSRFPVLMEGETSAGKTSMITQLAKMTGNRVHRINNHEHTDIQEYIGTYAPDADGRLQFVEGVLLKAVRNGDWIILDELNLAPSPVLEALNRLLDDNRELFVAELNTAVRAHPRFQLFATQNPVGSYAGRKRLSRAFLSRFWVMQCDALPLVELPQIVHRRCGIAPSMAQLMAAVLQELRSKRAISGIFTSSEGLMTLRDLFRWGNRMAASTRMDDWRQTLADQGYFVLAARCRTRQDERAVVEVLESKLGRKVDCERLFGPDSEYLPHLSEKSNIIVLTGQLRRILILCAEAWRCDEPVLLVGETGTGKTAAIHLFGSLLSINCNERTDASDLLGSIRPVSGTGGFQWQDGVVLQAMRNGQLLLIDEISLAPDSVLERLNSLLEPQRTIMLTDAGAGVDHLVHAKEGFQLAATMNPGNDHGKKELSKALRNRFTELWCTQEHSRNDQLQIVERRLVLFNQEGMGRRMGAPVAEQVAQFLVQFVEFFSNRFNEILRYTPSIRDLVALAELTAQFYAADQMSLLEALFHSIDANLLDALGVLPSRISFDREEIVAICVKQFCSLAQELELSHDSNHLMTVLAEPTTQNTNVDVAEKVLSIGPFAISIADQVRVQLPTGFSLSAPTTRQNALRVARALYSNKPVMLEGSPGAGKSSLIVALAAATGRKLVRLNLSEQTDLYDLFGNDVPVHNADGSQTSFAWKDGPVLRAIKEGHWILLDEMNLTSQSVLEGLNSCFDFRKQIFITELNKTFDVDTSRCKFFACQNPHNQGGDRRALPKSFLNRFISIYVDEMTDNDFIHILCEFCKSSQIDDGTTFGEDLLSKMVLVNKLCREQVQHSDWAFQCGGPFEFNLRDLFRWVEAIQRCNCSVAFGFDIVYLSRLTKREAREKVVSQIYNPIFSETPWMPSLPLIRFDETGNRLSTGNVSFGFQSSEDRQNKPNISLMASEAGLLEKLAACVQANWLVLLVGPAHVGKRSTIRQLAAAFGCDLKRVRLTTETDSLDLLGTYEQILTENLAENTEPEDELNRKLRFEWIDSTFVRAYREGHWLLVEDVNCCSSAVLDCLNSCLESATGELVLPNTQQNDDAVLVRRHKNFRVFFTMNPRNGSLSRAMRNRSLEIAFGTDLEITEQPPNDTGNWGSNICDVLSTLDNGRTGFASSCFSSENTRQLLTQLGKVLREQSPQKVLKSLALLSHCGQWQSDEHLFGQMLAKLLGLLTDNPEILALKVDDPRDLLGAYSFPALVRPNIRSLNPTNLAAYYWRCWTEVANVVPPAAVCVQLALLFPIPRISQTNRALLNAEFQSLSIKEKRNICSTISQLATNEAANDTDFLDERLFNATFPVERAVAFQRWKRVRDKAANQNLLGQRYLCALQQYSTNKCQSIGLIGRCKRQYASEEEEQMEVSDERARPTFELIGNCLAELFSTLEGIFGIQEQNELARLFAFGHMASIDFEKQHHRPSGEQKEITHTFYSYLKISSSITFSVNRLLWSPLRFAGESANLLGQLQVGELREAHNSLDAVMEHLWEFNFVQRKLRHQLRYLFEESLAKFEANCEHSSAIARLIDSIQMLTPPTGLVDPPYYAKLQNDHWSERLAKLNVYFEAIQSFLLLTIAKNYSFDQITSICSDITANPILQQIFDARRETTLALEAFAAVNTDELNGEETLNEDSKIYRNVWLEGQEEEYERHFQREFIERVRRASDHLSTALFNSNPPCASRTLEEAQLQCAKMENSMQTLDALKSSFLDTTDAAQFSPISIYPDLVLPYLSALNLLKLVVGEQYTAQRTWILNRVWRKANFAEKELNSLCQLFSHHQIANQSISAQPFIQWSLASGDQQLPAPLKLSICKWSFSMANHCRRNSIEWLFGQWEKWHEDNARIKAEEQLIVMKAKKKKLSDEEYNDEEGGEEITIDLEELRIQAYLPDFSEKMDDEDTVKQRDNCTINGDLLYNALRLLFNTLSSSGTTTEQCKLPFVAFMRVVDMLELYPILENENTMSIHHLHAIRKLRELLEFRACSKQISDSPATLNVYRESDPAALLHCLDLLQPLQERALKLLGEFSENAQLSQLTRSISEFIAKAQIGSPLMKHATQLERILVHAEEWEQIADRAHSLREQMVVLQELLVDWRRREVQCWNALINIVRADSIQLTALAGWPLFQSALNALKTGTQDPVGSETTARDVQLMLLEWMHNSTLGDFETRLWTGKLLAHTLSVLEEKTGEDGCNKPNKMLSTQFYSLCAYFEQFLPAVNDRYAAILTPIEQELRNLVRVVRYADLNVWTVRESAKRVHTQLFRILRKYKEMCNESLGAMLLDNLLRMPEQTLSPVEPFVPSTVESVAELTNQQHLFQSVSAFNSRLETIALSLFDLDELEGMRDAAVELLGILHTDINYEEHPKGSGKNKDDREELKTANEKLQGRALFERQQKFARLVSLAQRFGLSARRAHNIDSEALTTRTLVEVQPLPEKTSENKLQLFRHAIASRNVFLRRFATARRHQQPHLLHQVPTAALEHLRGVTEFGLHWLHNAFSAITQRIGLERHQLRHIAECYAIELHNARYNKNTEGEQTLSHAQMSAQFVQNREKCLEFTEIVSGMQQTIAVCPRQNGFSLPSSLHHMREPLGALRQSQQEYTHLQERVNQLVQIGHRMQSIHNGAIEGAVSISPKNGLESAEGTGVFVWLRSRWHCYLQSLNDVLQTLKDDGMEMVGKYFPREVEQLCTLCSELLIQGAEELVAQSEHEDQFSLAELECEVLLPLQLIYKEIEQCARETGNQTSPLALDRVKRLIGFVCTVDMEKIIGQLSRFFLVESSLLHSASPRSVDSIVHGWILSHGADQALQRILHYSSEFLSLLTSFHAHWVAIGCRLLSKGFVNPIPEPEKQSGSDQQVNSGEGSGFGEGELNADATDVSGQVENLEQIEGLKESGSTETNDHNTAEEDGGRQRLPEVDQPIDVEDDFAGNLEGLDDGEVDERQEGIDDETEEENREQHEQRTDWDFGELDEPEERHLDPKLWEPEEDEQKELKEGGNEGAEDVTADLAARQEEANAAENENQESQVGIPDEERQNGEELGEEDRFEDMTNGLPEGVDKKDAMSEEESEKERKEAEEDECENGAIEAEEESIGQVQETDGDEAMEEDDLNNEVGKTAEEENGEQVEANEAMKEQQGKVDQRQSKSAEQCIGTQGEGAEQTDQQMEQDVAEQADSANFGIEKHQSGRNGEREENNGDGGTGQMHQEPPPPIPDDLRDNNNGINTEQQEQQMEERKDANKDVGDVEAGESDRQLSASGSSTLEQAKRTRSLFDAQLRRLRREQQKADGQLAEEREEQPNGENEQRQEENALADKIDEQPEGEESGATDERKNIFTNFANQSLLTFDPSRSLFDPEEVNSIDRLAIDRLCNEFDKLEERQQIQKDAAATDSSEQNACELQLKWAMITESIAPLAAELTESLRAIIEPSVAARLEGDYRAGKRLNMRRLVSYIASDYRKDRIWMRRTKKARRNYQICIAVDNSQSMQHNHMTEITCNALCLIERALRQLEVGQLAICSFGSQVNLLSDFTASNDDPMLGLRILRELSFDQQRTDLAQLLCTTSGLFKNAREKSAQTVEQMLIILGDGRGVFTEGVAKIRKALSILSADRITVLFLVMDTAQKSITEMRIADFTGGECTFRPYMAQFPFQLFALVRDTHSLPATVAEAVRQWFEYTARS